jgi:uncharacterized membrane protein YczE
LSAATAARRTAAAGGRGRLARRLLQFLLGLALCATGVWLSLQAGLGVSPWDVLHAGITQHIGLSFGTVVIETGLLVLVAAAAAGVRPGVGTPVYIVLTELGLDGLLAASWLDDLSTEPVAVRLPVLLLAVVALGLGCALYHGAGFGAGPRDSLMVVCHRHGLPIGLSRCAIETSVLVAGFLLGGAAGVGTVVVALGTGPVVQVSLRLLRQQLQPAPTGAGFS